jgi:Skp family chaperone for outer membrane proteins
VGGLLLLLIAMPSGATAQVAGSIGPDAARIAYVSPQRAFFESNDGRAAQARLSSLESETSREVGARQAKLKALQQDLAQRASVLAEFARAEREQEIERFQIDLQRFMEDAQARFLGVRRDLENAFLAKFRPALDTVAKKRGLLFIINEDGGTLAWADASRDFTPDVVAALNQP